MPEDRKGDAGIGHEFGVAAPNWLGEKSVNRRYTRVVHCTILVRGFSNRDGVNSQGLHMEASESSGALRAARVLRVRTRHKGWYSLLTDTDSDFLSLFFTLLMTIQRAKSSRANA